MFILSQVFKAAGNLNFYFHLNSEHLKIPFDTYLANVYLITPIFNLFFSSYLLVIEV